MCYILLTYWKQLAEVLGYSPWFLMPNAPYVLSEDEAMVISASAPYLNVSKSITESILLVCAQSRDDAVIFDMAVAALSHGAKSTGGRVNRAPRRVSNIKASRDTQSTESVHGLNS